MQRQNQYARDDHEQAWQEASDRAPPFQQRWGVGIKVPPQRRWPRPQLPFPPLSSCLHGTLACCESRACAGPGTLDMSTSCLLTFTGEARGYEGTLMKHMAQA